MIASMLSITFMLHFLATHFFVLYFNILCGGIVLKS